jgi:hypothetical protein
LWLRLRKDRNSLATPPADQEAQPYNENPIRPESGDPFVLHSLQNVHSTLYSDTFPLSDKLNAILLNHTMPFFSAVSMEFTEKYTHHR